MSGIGRLSNIVRNDQNEDFVTLGDRDSSVSNIAKGTELWQPSREEATVKTTRIFYGTEECDVSSR